MAYIYLWGHNILMTDSDSQTLAPTNNNPSRINQHKDCHESLMALHLQVFIVHTAPHSDAQSVMCLPLLRNNQPEDD